LRQLAGFEAPAWLGKPHPPAASANSDEMLDDLTLSGEFAWGRLWAARPPPPVTPITFILRDI